MKIAFLRTSLAFLPVAAFALVTVGCTAPSGEAAPSAAETPTEESEIRASDVVGNYKANTEDDGYDFTAIKVARAGTKLTIDLDGETYDLSRTRSGAYVFTSGEISGECDSPGCWYRSRVSGVVYLKKVGTRKVASIKLTVKRMYEHPEYEGDLEGEISETMRWTKLR